MITNLKDGKLVELTREEIQQKAKSVYAQSPMIGLTDKYTFVPTSQVVDDMKKIGWIVVGATELRSKKRDGYQKHVLCFQNPKLKITSEQDGDSFPTVLLQNSHDGFSSFKINIGIFRLVCANGLVVSEKEFTKKTIRHKGYSFEYLKEVITDSVKAIPSIVEHIQKLSNIKIDKNLQVELAKKAYDIRYEGSVPSPETIQELLNPIRPEDNYDDAWTVINRIQEKMINGGFHFTTKKGKQRKAREVKNFVNDMKINQSLLELVGEYV